MRILNKLDYSDRYVSKLLPSIRLINENIKNLEQLKDSEISDLYRQLSNSPSASFENDSSKLLSLISIAVSRTLFKTPYEVQFLGSMVLARGNVLEMSTGEGKTLVAAMSALLTVALGDRVHIITANDYLVARDFSQMSTLYDFFNVKSSYITSFTPIDDRKDRYKSDIMYSTSAEIGFDFLRDSMCYSPNKVMQTPLCRAIVDEADSILLDEASTPMVISEETVNDLSMLKIFSDIIQRGICKSDVEIDMKDNICYMLDSGYQKLEKEAIRLGIIKSPEELYGLDNKFIFFINCSMQAHFMYFKDQHYLVKGGEVVIISEKTGRTMSGRRWSDGIHQAVEAKEGLEVKGDSRNLASITLQNLAKRYPHLSGMTGTAITDSIEFSKVYGLDTIRIPTHKPCIRVNHPDLIFPTLEGKRVAILRKVKQCVAKNQPVLIGTTTVQSSEMLSHLLNKEGVAHSVLNAKQHDKEAMIIAEAGVPGKVTIATNMAGRGTDIMLGGNVDHLNLDMGKKDKGKAQERYLLQKEISMNAGGLFVIASDKHNLRRIDNQLIGRCARQGEPGESQFFVSLEDELVKNFVNFDLTALSNMQKDPSQPIESNILSLPHLIRSAQKILESRSYESREELMKYDNIVDVKRNVVLKLHESLLNEDFDVLKYIDDIFFSLPDDAGYITSSMKELSEMDAPLAEMYACVRDKLLSDSAKNERELTLQALIHTWQEYINYIPQVRLNASLMSHAQKDPLSTFERGINESFNQAMDLYQKTVALYLIEGWKSVKDARV